MERRKGMIRIAVCDDEPEVVEKINDSITCFRSDNKSDFTVEKYYSGESLVKSKKKSDLVFLDIEMKELDGIETAQEIRSEDVDVKIVYITSYTDYWKRAYKVHAFDFISKPFSDEEIHNVLKDFLKFYNAENEKTVELRTADGAAVLKVKDILYFYIKDKEKRKVIVNTNHGEYVSTESLREIYEKLNSEEFYKAHKSCIVNLRYVQSVTKNNGGNITMTDGTSIPLAIKKQNEFLYLLSKQLRKG